MDILTILAWVTAIGMPIITFIGFIFNALITNKIDSGNVRITELEKGREDDKKEYYEQLNGLRRSIEDHYVRKDLYQQAMQFHSDKNDAEFKSLLAVVNTQFANMELKYENMDEKIDDIKNLIAEKLDGHKKI